MLPLFLGAWVLGLIVYLAARKTVVGDVGECAACIRNRRTTRAALWVGWVGGWALYIAAVSVGSDNLAGAAALVLLAAAVGNLLVLARRTGGRVTNDLEWVYLTRIAPDVAAKLEPQDSDSRPLS